MTDFKRHINIMDMAALIFMGLVFGVSLYAWLSGAGRTRTFTLLTGIVLAALLWLILMPIRYRLTEEALVIEGPWPLKTRSIRYRQILDLDSAGSFLSFKADADAVELIVTWKKDGSDRLKKTACHPSHAKEFYEELESRCPNLVKHERTRPIKDDVVAVLAGQNDAQQQNEKRQKE